MVEAGIARRVDFGEGKFRYEHSYRHPRHFHLICKSCNQSFEFLSSDVESLIEEVASARRFTPRESVLQIYGDVRIVPHWARGRAGAGVDRCGVRAGCLEDGNRHERSGASSTRAPRV
jgi:hypothetical protein